MTLRPAQGAPLSRAALELSDEEIAVLQKSIGYKPGWDDNEEDIEPLVAAAASAKAVWAVVAWLRLAYHGAPGVLLARNLVAVLEQAGVREPRQA